MRKLLTILLILGGIILSHSFSDNHNFDTKPSLTYSEKNTNLTSNPCPIKEAFTLDIIVQNGIPKVFINFNYALGNYRDVKWFIRNPNQVKPGLYLKKGIHNLSKGSRLELNYSFDPCRSYEITIEYDACGTTDKETKTIKKPTIDFDIFNSSTGYRGVLKSSPNSFPIAAITPSVTWEVIGYGNITVPSTQTTIDFSSALGFPWVNCNLYSFKLTYTDNCNGNTRILGPKDMHYSPQLYTGGIPILTNSNGNTRRFNGYRYVRTGKTITVKNSIIEFEGKNSGIIVEPGGTLIIDNSTIQGMCNSTWGGITVQGDQSKPVIASNQGYLVVRNNSNIKNAKIAINASNGAIISTHKSNFINNEIAINAFNRSNAQIGISECNFTTDDSILFSKMKYFIKLNNTSAIFSGNTFINNQTPTGNTSDLGVGIVSYYSNIKVLSKNSSGPYNPNDPYANSIPNTFQNLYKGIDHYANHGNTSILVTRSTFTNVAKCISSSRSKGDRITLNEFNIADVAKSSGGLGSLTSGWGVHTSECNNHIIDENTFKGADYSYGIINSHTGYTTQNLPTTNSGIGGKLYLNDFDNMLIAIQIQGPNDNTEISCNNFVDNNQYGINIEKITSNGTTYNGRLGHQGSCGLGKGAGNQFNSDFMYQYFNCFVPKEFRYIKLNGSFPFTYTDVNAMSLSSSPCTDSSVNFQDASGCGSAINLFNKCETLHTTIPTSSKITNLKSTDFEIALLNNNIELAESLLDDDFSIEILNAYRENSLLDLKITPLTLHKEEILFNELDANNIGVYPNPTINGRFNISVKNSNIRNNLMLDIFNIQGKRILQSSLSGPNENIDISKYPKGFYILKIHNGKEIISYSKLIYR
ncbi:T9SS type A sorting domain-containing protein [Tenacibaculum amylolyticum]|uniref:T9SS type A sorting domain-containing protein n=1 Tax=Tenacibaculum amylolyticum TaxID=104269 RepID=UPI003895CF3F